MVAQRSPAETLRLYRSDHRITPVLGDGITRCSVDDIRVDYIRGGRMRHDPYDILKLMQAEYGGPWGQPRSVEQREEAIERVAAIADLEPDEDYEFDREGQPEFNGSFR